MERFKTPDGKRHLIDDSGNHFVNNRCVNPKTTESGFHYIGETHPPTNVRTTLGVNITGKVPFKIDSEGRFVRL